MIIDAHAINGDCFEIHNWSDIVVDIGPCAEPSQADIVLLTHDDKDHIDGALKYLQTTPGKLDEPGRRHKGRELWVPYEWGVMVKVLVEIQRSRGEHVTSQDSPAWRLIGESVVDSDQEAREGPLRAEVLSSLERTYWPPVGHDDQEVVGRPESEGVDEERDPLAAPVSELYVEEALADVDIPPAARTVDERIRRTAKETAGILQTAYRQHWSIRYFDHCRGCMNPHWQQVGNPGVFTLISAREMRLAPPRDNWSSEGALNMALAAELTQWNKRSLVSFAWDTAPWGRSCGAVCWADARGPEGHPVPCFSVTTAPHHGSSNPEHDSAWKVIQRETCGDLPFLVSSFNSSVSGPRAEFVRWPSRRRACTVCWKCRALRPRPQTPVRIETHCGRDELPFGTAWSVICTSSWCASHDGAVGP